MFLFKKKVLTIKNIFREMNPENIAQKYINHSPLHQNRCCPQCIMMTSVDLDVTIDKNGRQVFFYCSVNYKN